MRGILAIFSFFHSLMSQLPDIFANNKTPQVVLEPVVRAGMEALKAAGRNGRLFVFHSSLPSAQATGMLKNRLDTKLLGTDKEKVWSLEGGTWSLWWGCKISADARMVVSGKHLSHNLFHKTSSRINFFLVP